MLTQALVLPLSLHPLLVLLSSLTSASVPEHASAHIGRVSKELKLALGPLASLIPKPAVLPPRFFVLCTNRHRFNFEQVLWGAPWEPECLCLPFTLTGTLTLVGLPLTVT